MSSAVTGAVTRPLLPRPPRRSSVVVGAGRPPAPTPTRLGHDRRRAVGASSVAAAAARGDGRPNNNDDAANPDRLPSLDEDDLPPRATPSPPSSSPTSEPSSSSPSSPSLSAELARYAAPQRLDAARRAAERLDLAWSITRSPRGSRARSECGCCSGSGRAECRWCRGTGAMMLGGSVLERGGGGEGGEGAAGVSDAASAASAPPPTCLVCKGRGYVACEDCRGTGYRASWMGPSECKTRR